MRFVAEPDNWVRTVLESRLLAREDRGRIARRCRVAREVVEAYEAVFFDVADRLDDEAYIRDHALGPAGAGPPGAYRGRVEKLLGYRGGPEALDAVRDLALAAPIPRPGDDLGAWVAREAGKALKVRGLFEGLAHRLGGDDFAAVDEFLGAMGIGRGVPTPSGG